jgi:peptidoglycan hydrolase-like protein with peptidoglycan-binding domain
VTSLGVDYYGLETATPPDFNKAYAGGIRYAICKAVNGRPVRAGQKAPYLDPAWARDKDRITAAGLIRGAYLFLCYPRKGFYTPEPETQAQAFVDYVQLTSKDFVPQFDVEEASDVLNAQEMYDWTLRCATALGLAYKAMPGMYTSNRVWKENLGSHSAGGLLPCPLWLAKPWPWPVRSPAHLTGMPASPTLIPQWGNQWWIYQYQGDALKVPGFASTCDLNSFNVLSKGAKSDTVAWAQRRLPEIKVDGDFGPATDAAVKTFQTANKLVSDGVIGPATFACLSWVKPR